LIEVDDSTWNAPRACEGMNGNVVREILGRDVPIGTVGSDLSTLYASQRLALVSRGIYSRMGRIAQLLDGGEARAVPVPLTDQERQLRQATLVLINQGGDRTWGMDELARNLRVRVPLMERVLERLGSEREITRLGPQVWAPRTEPAAAALGGRSGRRIAAPERMLLLMSQSDRSWKARKLESALGDVVISTIRTCLSDFAREGKIFRLGDGWYARLGTSQPTQERLMDAIVRVVAESGERRPLAALEIEQAIHSEFPPVESERVYNALPGLVRAGRLQRTSGRGMSPVFVRGPSGEAR
jgi:hypothetical protein